MSEKKVEFVEPGNAWVIVRELVDPLTMKFSTTKIVWLVPNSTLEDVAPSNIKALSVLGFEAWAVVGGERIERDCWQTRRVLVGDEIAFLYKPQGAEVLVSLAISLILTAVQYFLAKHQKVDKGDSPTYSFGTIENTVEEGSVIPVAYGRIKVGGQYIASYQSLGSDGNTELNAMIALSQGEIEAIAGEDADFNGKAGKYGDIGIVGSASDVLADKVIINNLALASLPDVEVSGRLGSNTQEIITGFQDLITSYPVGQKMETGAGITVDVGLISGLEVLIDFPGGCYYQGPSGLHGVQISYSIYFKAIENGYLGNGPPPPGTVPNSAPNNYGGYVRTVTKSFKKTSPFVISEKFDSIWGGKYIITVVRNSPEPDGQFGGYSTKTFLNSITGKLKGQGVAYVNTAVLAVKAVASDQISGQLPNVNTVIKGRKVWILSGGTYANPTFTKKYTTNPAWILLDLLTNRRYGAGKFITACDIDFQSFSDFANYCSATITDLDGTTQIKRWEIGIQFDSQEGLWEQCQKIAAASRSVLVKVGKLIKVKIDQAASPVQLFTMGNIVEGSFKLHRAAKGSRPNFIEVRFLNEKDGFNRDFAIWHDASSSARYVRRAIDLPGITHPARAYRAAKFAWNLAQLVQQTVEFRVPIESLALEPMDVFAVAHDAPKWGTFSGRCSATASATNKIKLDRTLVISGAEVPTVTIRLTASGVETISNRTITNGAGTYAAGTELTLNTVLSSIPQKGDPYSIIIPGVGAFGTSYAAKQYRCMSIERDSDGTALVTGVNYDPNIYSDDPGILSHLSGSTASDPGAIPNAVTNLTLQESATVLSDGITVTSSIVVGWAPVVSGGGLPSSYRVYLKTISTPGQALPSGFSLIGETVSPGFVIGPDFVSVGSVYAVAVVPVSANGTSASPDSSASAQIELFGVTDLPPDVVGLVVTQPEPGRVTLDWTDVKFPNWAGWEVRRGDSWQQGIVCAQVTVNHASITDIHPVYNQTFLVKGFTKDGKYSETATQQTFQCSIGGWTSGTNVPEQATWPGNKFNCTVESGLIRQTFAPIVLNAATFQLDSGAGEYTSLDENLMSYHSQTYNLGTNSSRYIVAELSGSYFGNAIQINQCFFALDSEEGEATTIDFTTAVSGAHPHTRELQISRSSDGVVFGAFEPFHNGSLYTNATKFIIALLSRRKSKNFQDEFDRLEIQTYTQ